MYVCIISVEDIHNSWYTVAFFLHNVSTLVLTIFILTCKLYVCTWIDVYLIYTRCVYIKSMHEGRSKSNFIICLLCLVFSFIHNYVSMYGCI